MTTERLQLLGKIGLLDKEIKELRIRIENRQNAIRLATAPFFSIEELERKLPDLEEAVKGYTIALNQLNDKMAHWRRLQEELE